ncbi:agmatine ureohydrolase (agmatinase) [Scheffersomyces stipitis CBS 6054]|uniref:Agmatine ureohydrolase (Agmatinase) n=1 Tax=Scheffersomyces stipitis (strain ATCC 58785 / CBS 6054 / NBRC 10063 / NRRL Y-11545) TaxID=322104 RepID=A3LWL7_PICST|nr:agmatine ureohydrolase (agmatinase) [Scheffersomyces stipitis CBS 6054]ABN67305.1 agmatine ureohydrolase (agmatinase) [Scheffersomyces stipitis CBS 6054]
MKCSHIVSAPIFLSVAAAVLQPVAWKSDELINDSIDGSSPSLKEMWDDLWPFQGINTFAHLDHHKCLLEPGNTYDVALIGVPFDTAVSYRPGARFGPRAIRAASQRQTSLRGYNQRANFNPYASWAKIVDCGDLPITPMDNSIAFTQMTKGFEELLLRRSSNSSSELPPRYVALGGDHSVLLPHLRALHEVYGRINVIHFDAHLDTWAPDKYPSFWHSDQSEINHGSMLWKAHHEGLTSHHNVHAGLRTKLSGLEDYEDDDSQHFIRIDADDIWLKGPQWVVQKILDTVPDDSPTYISVDVDVLDPGFTSGTGTQEPGGWLPRELLHVLRSIEGLTVVGGDVVEVSPAFDTAEITSTNGAQIAFEIITSMVKKGPIDPAIVKKNKKELVKITHVNELEQEKKDFIDLEKAKKTIEQKLKELDELKSELSSQLLELREIPF